MKTIRISLFFLIFLIFTACNSNNLSNNILNSSNDNSESGLNNDSNESGLNNDTAELDSNPNAMSINKLDISNFEGTVPADLQEMLVYGEINLNEQIIYIADISEFGMDDDEINNYGLWHESINRVFCGFEEQTGDSIKGILTSPDGTQTFYNSTLEPNQFGEDGYCIGFRISSLESGGPYGFSLEISNIEIRDIFNVYLNTLIVSNWEPNERIRIITYSHEGPFSPTGNYNGESYINANQNGELWIEIDDKSSNSLWENDLIAILMYGESGKIAEFFTEKDYSSIEENASYPSGN